MEIKKSVIDDWLFDGNNACCKFCQYRDTCSGGVRCYGGVPLYPYCAENDDTDNIEYDNVLDYLEDNMKDILFTLKLEIKKVIFNEPATIVFWSNGDKTIVKCQPGDTFDKEKGLALAITKYFFGNKSNYNKVIKKYTENGEK